MPFLFFYLDFDYFFLIFVSGNYYSELDGSSGRGFACKIWTSWLANLELVSAEEGAALCVLPLPAP